MGRLQDTLLCETSWTQKVQIPLTWGPGGAKFIRAEGVCERREHRVSSQRESRGDTVSAWELRELAMDGADG